MKIGMVFECGPDGADQKVCKYLASRIRPDLTVIPVALDNKPNLIQKCGEAAAQLLSTDGCQQVLIMWDLYPNWRPGKPCRKQDRDDILANLKIATVDLSKVHLICIQEELEAWLLADGGALSEVLSQPSHKIKIKGEKRPDTVVNPKAQLRKIFSKIGRDYNDKLHAEKIVRKSNLKQIEHSKSFKRFKTKLEQF